LANTNNVKVSGVWKTAVPYVKVAGVWKKCTQAWLKVAGVWKQTIVVGAIVNWFVDESGLVIDGVLYGRNEGGPYQGTLTLSAGTHYWYVNNDTSSTAATCSMSGAATGNGSFNGMGPASGASTPFTVALGNVVTIQTSFDNS
jgi:hypothetical protein